MIATAGFAAGFQLPESPRWLALPGRTGTRGERMDSGGSAGGGPLLVISAHAGDFVWRAGGARALASSRGGRVTVVCLSFGERGESRRRGTQLRRNAGPNLGLAHTTMAEAYMRVYPQVTGVLA